MNLPVERNPGKNLAMWKALLAGFALLFWLGGCGDGSDHSTVESTEPTPVFSALQLPANAAEAEEYFQGVEAEADALLAEVMLVNEPTWENTVAPVVAAKSLLSGAYFLAERMRADSQKPELQAVCVEAFQKFNALLLELSADENILARTAPFLEGEYQLSPEQQLDLRGLYADISRMDDQVDIQEFRTNTQELFNLSYQFYLNTQSAVVPVTVFTPDELACLPEGILAYFDRDAQGNYLYQGYPLFALLTSCLADEVRTKVYASYHSRGFAENGPLWPLIVERRHEYATQLGHPNYASAGLEYNLLNSPTQVWDFLDEVALATDPAYGKLAETYRQLQEAETGIRPTTMTAWNALRYQNQLEKEQAQQNPDLRGDYLPHNQTVDNLLLVVGQVFGLRFVAEPLEKNLWSPSLRMLRVYDADSDMPVGTLLYEPRGTSYVTTPIEFRQKITAEFERTPTVVLTTAFRSMPEDDFFLSRQKLISLSHELGHALHYLLDRQYHNAHLVIDFGEVPSTFLEHYVQQPEVLLGLLSDNPLQSDRAFPENFWQWWEFSSSFGREDLASVRYSLAKSATFLEATSWEPGTEIDLGQIGRDNLAAYHWLYPPTAEPFYDSHHLIEPNYDVSYYLYLLGEVLATDSLKRFSLAPGGVMSREMGRTYRQTILEQGIFNPQQAIRAFLGRDMQLDAFAERYRQMAEQW